MAEYKVFSLQGDGELRAYKRRKLHAKTATGCLACRAKRVKCDEARPACKRCIRNARECCFDPGTLVTRQAAKLERFTAIETGVPSRLLMEHCQRHWDEIFDIPAKARVLGMAIVYPVLAKSILAMSASHLRRQGSTTQLRVAEHFHLASALRECQRLMQMPPQTLDTGTVKALTLSALFLNMLAFALAEPEDEFDLARSWVFSEHDNRLGWLTLQEGIRHLLRSTAGHLQSTIDFLSEIFVGPGEVPRPWITSHIADIPTHWLEFFEINNGLLARRPLCDAVLPERGGAFFPAVNSIWKMPAAHAGVKVFHFFPFLLKVNSDLRLLLLKRDPKAMWLMGFWLASMLHQNELWWFHGRVRRDYTAVRIWLSQHAAPPDGESALWAKMMREMDQAVQRGQ